MEQYSSTFGISPVVPYTWYGNPILTCPYGVFGMGYEYEVTGLRLARAYIQLQFYFRHNGAVLQYIPNPSRYITGST
jgi:hypothetical protein